MKSQRKHPRIEGVFQVDLLNTGEDPSVPQSEAIVNATALDVSRQGMKLKVYYNAPVGALLSVIFYVGGADSVCLAEVIWRREENEKTVYGLYTKEWSKLSPELEAMFAAVEKGA